MSTRRERLTRKAERRRGWASKAHSRAQLRFDTAHRIADGIPLGQPILVGHHSERRARKDAERIRGNMDKGISESNLSENHDSKAEGIEGQLDRSIYSDDTDATQALQERIDTRLQELERVKAINKAIRAGAGWEARLSPPLTDKEKAELLSLARAWGNVYKPGYPPYHLSNLNGRIRADRERLKAITARTARTEQAEATGGVLVQGDEWIRVTFAEKPSRTVINELKAAGFCWSNGSWIGKRDALPETVKENQP